MMGTNMESKPEAEKLDPLHYDAWKYFSSRADTSANVIRGILLASSNAGAVIVAERLTDAKGEYFANLDRGLETLVHIMAGCIFLFCIWKVLSSWDLQKKKATDRRSDIAKSTAFSLGELECIIKRGEANHLIESETKYSLIGGIALLVFEPLVVFGAHTLIIAACNLH